MNTKLFPYLSYKDASAALKWYEAIGFTIVRKQEGDNNTIVHSEIKLGEVVLMVSSYDAEYHRAPLVNYSTGNGLYLFIEDVEAIYEKAIAAGATTVIPPEKTDWGSMRARVLDPEGIEWSLGTYEPGIAS